MEGINHKVNGDYENTLINNDSNLKFPLLPSQKQSSSLKRTTWKDERLGLLDIPKGLVEVLENAGFTIEMILEYGPSKIAENLGIDDYVAQIIFNETTKKSINKL